MKCKCKKTAVINVKHLGKAFCKEHFIKSFEKRVKQTVSKNNLIKKNDVIAVANSGGKDSFATLLILKKLFPKNKIFSLTIDEGLRGYRNKTIKDVKKYCKKLGTKSHIFSFKDEIKQTMDFIAKHQKSIPCMSCGISRRYLLNKKARELGATKIATGHNLDDETQSIMMNIVQNNTNRFIRQGPISGVVPHKKFVPRIKPLREITEKETMIYCLLNNIKAIHTPCKFAHFAFRNVIRDNMNQYESENPGTKLKILKRFDSLRKQLIKKQKIHRKYVECKICKEPTSYEICEACNLKSKIKLMSRSK